MRSLSPGDQGGQRHSEDDLGVLVDCFKVPDDDPAVRLSCRPQFGDFCIDADGVPRSDRMPEPDMVDPQSGQRRTVEDAKLEVQPVGQEDCLQSLRDPLILYFAMLGKLFDMRQARA
jgi:hypothetical protein